MQTSRATERARDDQRTPVLAQPRGLQRTGCPRHWSTQALPAAAKRLAEFSILERLTYFLLVTKVGINERIETYAALTKEIQAGNLQRGSAALTTLTLTDAQSVKFVAALDGTFTTICPKARMALVLRQVTGARTRVQLQNAVSLEHVLPQTPPDGSDGSVVSDPERAGAWTPPGQLGWPEQELIRQQLRLREKNVYFKGQRALRHPSS